MEKMSFGKNLKILVTAGPTWVAIDSVRVITSIFSGNTGLAIARFFAQKQARVDLLLGAGGRPEFLEDDKSLFNITPFFYYDELKGLLEQKLYQNNYDIVIHSSAVADYTPLKTVKGKISSCQDNLDIKLISTEKLVDKIKLVSPKSTLVKFKLQVGLEEQDLLDRAYKSLQQSKADLIIANDLEHISGTKHIAYIIRQDKSYIKTFTKQDLCQNLFEELENLY